MGYTWDDMYDRLRVDHGGLPGRSTQDMLNRFWTLAGYPDGTLGADQKEAFYRSQGAIGVALGDLEHDYWHRVGPNIMAAMGAVFAVDAAQAINGEQWALNRGSAGQVLRARYGSVGRAEIRNGVGLVLPGTAGNTARLPSSAGIDTSGNFELMFEGSIDLENSNNQHLIVRDDQATNRVWYLTMGVAKTPQLVWWSSTGAIRVLQAAVPMALTSGQNFAVKAELIQDDGLGNTICRFYSAPSSAGPWTQIGADVVGNYTTPRDLRTGQTCDVQFLVQNSTSGGAPQTGGVVRRAWLKAGVNGTSLFDIDFTTQPDLTTSFVCTTGQTVTITAANAADTNDPMLLPWAGENYLHVTGSTAAVITPSPASFNITTPIDYEIDAELNYSVAGFQQVLIAASSATPAGVVLLYIQDGRLAVRTTINGAARFSVGPIRSGVIRDRIRVTANPSTGLVSVFLWSGSSWVLHFSNVVATGPWTSNTVEYVTFGDPSTPNRVFSLSCAHNNGTVFARFTGDDLQGRSDATTFPISVGTMNMNRPATGRKSVVVTRPVWLFGTDDFMEVADNDLLDFADGQDFTVVAVVRMFLSDDWDAIVDKRGSNASNDLFAGYGIYRHATQPNAVYGHAADGTVISVPVSPTGTQGQLIVASAVMNGDQYRIYRNTASTAVTQALGSLVNSLPLRIGGLANGGGAALDGEVSAVGVFRRALTVDEVTRIVTAYGAS